MSTTTRKTNKGRMLLLTFGFFCAFLALGTSGEALPFPAFTGNTFLDNIFEPPFGNPVDGTVNYAVFPSASFVDPGGFVPGTGSSPTLDLTGTYVYLYQVANNTRDGGPVNTLPITGLSVGTFGLTVTSWGYFFDKIFTDDFGAAVTAVNHLGVDTRPAGGSGMRTGISPVGFRGLGAAINPADVELSLSSVTASFLLPASGGVEGEVDAGKTGSVMVFTALGPPIEGSAHIDDGGTASDDPVPTANPIPEPGTLFLLGSGLLGAAVWVRRRFHKNGDQ